MIILIYGKKSSTISLKTVAHFFDFNVIRYHDHHFTDVTTLSLTLFSSSTGVPPKIEALPENVSAEAGKSLTVAGVFSGDPVPSVQWVRSGRTLPNGDERYHVENTADHCTLMISAVKEGDAGAYTLRLSNEFGSDTATVNVHIRSM